MNAKIIYFFVSIAGLAATALACFYLYQVSKDESLSTVIIWGSIPLLLFIFIWSVYNFIKGLKTFRK
jgi:hypothetical protein